MREPIKAIVDVASICNRTYRQKVYFDEFVGRAKKISDDNDRARRLEECLCVMCYYPYGAGSQGGTCSTIIECGFCDKQIRFGSTHVDVLCLDCAKKNSLCKHCGADIDLKQRRKNRPFQERP